MDTRRRLPTVHDSHCRAGVAAADTFSHTLQQQQEASMAHCAMPSDTTLLSIQATAGCRMQDAAAGGAEGSSTMPPLLPTLLPYHHNSQQAQPETANSAGHSAAAGSVAAAVLLQCCQLPHSSGHVLHTVALALSICCAVCCCWAANPGVSVGSAADWWQWLRVGLHSHRNHHQRVRRPGTLRRTPRSIAQCMAE